MAHSLFRFPLRPTVGRNRHQSHHAGFTLIEIAITITIVGILLTTAIPAYNAFRLNTRITAEVNRLFQALYLARSTAISRGKRVTMCKSNDGTSCTSASSWEQGWLIFVDENADNALDASEEILSRQKTLPDNVSLSYSAWGSRNYVTYYPTGLTQGTNGTFTLCDSRGDKYAKAIVLYKTGRPRIATVKPNGDPLSCP